MVEGVLFFHLVIEASRLPMCSLITPYILKQCCYRRLRGIVEYNKNNCVENTMITNNLFTTRAARAAVFAFASQLVVACNSDVHSGHAELSVKNEVVELTAKISPVPWSLSQDTDKKTFSANFSCDKQPHLGDFQICHLALKREGEPVLGAKISIDGGMKAHGHGLPTAPQVSPTKTPGKYKVEGLKFSMPGEWIIGFKVVLNQPKLSDQVIFAFSI